MGDFLEIQGISKSFFGVYALKDISFSIKRGSVHAIMGENGAGKSTLMKILGGVYLPDSGRILIDGEEKKIRTVQDAARAGIRVIYQEFNLVPELTVAENIYIADTPKRTIFGLVEKDLRRKKTERLLEMLRIEVDANALVKDLSVSQKQMVEIAKALSQDSEIIIMDEPTAALNDEEVERLEEMIRLLKGQGKTILYISHRLREVFDVSDTVTVLRDGKYVATKPTDMLTEQSIIRLMVGHEIDAGQCADRTLSNETVLAVKNFSKRNTFENVTFELHRGEILGIAGLMGCKREEMLSALYGLIRADEGEIYIDGTKTVIHSVKDALKNGICFLTDDRKDAGILPLMSVEENLTIMSIRNLKKKLKFYISERDEHKQLDEMTRSMSIKYADAKQKIAYLSGGNQQKVLLGRNLLLHNKIFIMLEPTRGIDVGAKEEIYRLLRQLADQGMGILEVFSDMNELIKVCDRTLVFWQGKITGDLRRSEFDKERILFCATGKGGGEDDEIEKE